jgi:hypothetical protein
MFELNFRDERYLPFEGVGVISSWRLELPGDLRQFDYKTISDVVLHIRYTARDGGEALKSEVTDRLLDALRLMQVEQGKTGLFRLFSLKHDFPERWHQFLHSHPASGESPNLKLELSSVLFPSFAADKTININRLTLVLKTKGPITYDPNNPLLFQVTLPAGGVPKELAAQAVPGNLEAADPATLSFQPGVTVSDKAAQSVWMFAPSAIPDALRSIVDTSGGLVAVIDPETVDDLVLLCSYTLDRRPLPSSTLR